MAEIVSKFLGSIFGFRNKPKKIIMIGLDAAGKTTILYRMRSARFEEVVTKIPTIGFNIEQLKLRLFDFTVWDVGGCDKIRPLWLPFFAGLEALVYVIDCNDRCRIDEMKEELSIFLSIIAVDVPLLVFANKQDLPDAMSVPVLTAHIQDMLKAQKWLVQGCSALSGEGLSEGFDWLAAALSHDNEKLSEALQHTNHSVRISYLDVADGPNLLKATAELPQEIENEDNDTLTTQASSTPPAAVASGEAAIEPDVDPQEVGVKDSMIHITTHKLEEEEVAAIREQERKRVMASWLTRSEGELSTEQFLSKVRNYSLESWDHYTHVRLAWCVLHPLYLRTSQMNNDPSLVLGEPLATSPSREEIEAGYAEIELLIRSFIAHSNRTNGRSFHATMTRFWCCMINACCRKVKDAEAIPVDAQHEGRKSNKMEVAQGSVDDNHGFLEFLLGAFEVYDLWDSSLFSKYYSRARIFSAEARVDVLAPDLQPLP